MPFDLNDFCQLRPYAYHLTSKDNVPRMRAMRRLESTLALLQESNMLDLADRRRATSRCIKIDSTNVRLQNQAPLHEGNIVFEENWKLNDLIKCLNSHVFFWPGTYDGPIKSGRNHFASSLWGEAPCVLRFSTSVLFSVNQNATPRFCAYNSGSPRCVNGRKSPRGPKTFVSGTEFSGTPSKVVEIAFHTEAILPRCAQISASPSGPWELFFA